AWLLLATRGIRLLQVGFLAPDGFPADPVRRVCAGVWARLHLCAVEPARPFGFAGPHPDARHRDPRLDAHARRLDWDCGARNAADAEHADRAFAACRRTAPGQSAGTGAVSDAAVQPDDARGDRRLEPRSDAAGGDDRLYRRFRADADRHPG